MYVGRATTGLSIRVPLLGIRIGGGPQEVLNVFVTERRPRIGADLRHALDDEFGRDALPRRIKLIDGEFTFAQLKSWKDRALQVMAINGVTRLDIDDFSNRLLVGVAPGLDGGSDDSIADELAAQAIPPAGWRIDEVAPVEQDASLQDAFRPVSAGVQVQFVSAFTSTTATLGACTYGLTAIRDGVAGFITNSHCSLSRGNLDSGLYYQSRYGEVAAFAQETRDPSYFSGGSCPSGRQCRFSDSLFARRTDSSVDLRASIAKNAVGSMNWDGISRYYVVGAENALPGDIVHKIGRSTGHTTGRVDATDYIDNGGDGTTYLRQYSATYLRGSGDSGAPVFKVKACSGNPNGGQCAVVVGLHRGTSDVGAAFSPISAVRAELGGSIRMCTTDFNC
jgi:hypothetical protein